jgi:hypothetical protein
MKGEQAPGGIFQPRRAQVRCRWRKRASQGDLAAATYIPARGEIVSHDGLLTLVDRNRRERFGCYFGWEKEDMGMESKDNGTNCSRAINHANELEKKIVRDLEGEVIDWLCTSVDQEVHEVEDLLRCPSELGHPALDPDELNLQGGENESGRPCRRGQRQQINGRAQRPTVRTRTRIIIKGIAHLEEFLQSQISSHLNKKK